MTVTVSKAGPYYSTGEIKFSSLRSNFRAQVRKQTSSGSETFNTDTAEIKASQLRRITITTDTNPNVPDATENANITTGSNWKPSQFRGSIKYYYITQSGTDVNFDIDAQSWNSNLNKNVRKFLFVDGTCGSNAASSPAAQLSATAYNLTVDVSGSILGASGRGGGTTGAPAIAGESGGSALEMTSSSGANNIVLIKSGAKIYGGGGGGEKGLKGADGASGTCVVETQVDNGCQEQDNSRCPGGWNQVRSWNDCCNWNRGCSANYWRKTCQLVYSVSGGTGGEGGNGGPGRGYNNQSGSLTGSPGASGTSGATCTSGGSYSVTPGTGLTGEPGGTGGEWANSGGNTLNSSAGGGAGKAIFGSNYSLDPNSVINSNTVKGTYT